MRSTVEKLRGADMKQTRGRGSAWLSGGAYRAVHAIGRSHLLATEEGVPMDGSPATTQRGPLGGHGRVLVAIIATALVCGATAAGAAKLITGSDVQNALAIRVTGGLPTQKFSASNSTVKNTPDGVKFGPYADGGTEFGSLCT